MITGAGARPCLVPRLLSGAGNLLFSSQVIIKRNFRIIEIVLPASKLENERTNSERRLYLICLSVTF